MASRQTSRALTDSLRRHAKHMGIDLLGCTSASPFRVGEEQREIVPRDMMPGAKSIVVAACYTYGCDIHQPSSPGAPRGLLGPWTRASVPAYAYAESVLTAFLQERGHRVVPGHDLPCKPAAVRSGIARYGKNCIVHADGLGSYLEIVALLTDAELDCTDGPVEVSDCGDCTACLEACPTGALARPYHLLRERCICQWLWGDPIPLDAREHVGAHIFRCGFCQEACPRNRQLPSRTRFPFQLQGGTDSPELIPLLLGDEEHYRTALPGFLMEAAVDTIRRNAAIAAGNAGDPAAVPALIRVLDLPNSDARAAAAWALGKLGGRAARAALKDQLGREPEATVREEVEHALRNAG